MLLLCTVSQTNTDPALRATNARLTTTITSLINRDGDTPTTHNIKPQDRAVIAGVAYGIPRGASLNLQGSANVVYAERLVLPARKRGSGIASHFSDCVGIYYGRIALDRQLLEVCIGKDGISPLLNSLLPVLSDRIRFSGKITEFPWSYASRLSPSTVFQCSVLTASQGYWFQSEQGYGRELFGDYPTPKTQPVTEETVERLADLVGKLRKPRLLPAIPKVSLPPVPLRW